MKVERSIAAPLRSAQQTTDELAIFIAEVLTARSFPAAAQVNAQIKRLAPLLNLLVAKRIAGTPALRLSTHDMQIQVSVDHETGAVDNMSIPALTLLRDLDPQAPINITLYATEEIPSGLRALVIFVSGAPARLTLVVEAIPQAAAQPAETTSTTKEHEAKVDAL